jgi:ubiquinone/menaquinone biosynthesis C-methylase UbiE
MAKGRSSAQVARQFDALALIYEFLPIQANAHKKLFSVPAPTPDQTVVDIGCGTGGMLLELGRTARCVYGVDISAGMLAKAREHVERSSSTVLVRASAERLPFMEESADYVVSYTALHHVDELGEALREVARIIRPGGVVHIVDIVAGGATGKWPVLSAYLVALAGALTISLAHGPRQGWKALRAGTNPTWIDHQRGEEFPKVEEIEAICHAFLPGAVLRYKSAEYCLTRFVHIAWEKRD